VGDVVNVVNHFFEPEVVLRGMAPAGMAPALMPIRTLEQVRQECLDGRGLGRPCSCRNAKQRFCASGAGVRPMRVRPMRVMRVRPAGAVRQGRSQVVPGVGDLGAARHVESVQVRRQHCCDDERAMRSDEAMRRLEGRGSSRKGRKGRARRERARLSKYVFIPKVCRRGQAAAMAATARSLRRGRPPRWSVVRVWRHAHTSASGSANDYEEGPHIQTRARWVS